MLARLWPLERCAQDDRACIFWCDPISSFPALAGNRGAAQAVARPGVLLRSLSSSPVQSLPLFLCLSVRGCQFDKLIPIGNGMIGGFWHPPWPVCSAVRCRPSPPCNTVSDIPEHVYMRVVLCVWHVCMSICSSSLLCQGLWVARSFLLQMEAALSSCHASGQ